MLRMSHVQVKTTAAAAGGDARAAEPAIEVAGLRWGATN